MGWETTGEENSVSYDRNVLLDRNFLRYTSSAALADFVQPIFTLFLPLLALELGGSVLEIGLVGGASNLVYAFMPFVMGKFSDRGQARTLFIILSLALLSTVSILYYFAGNPIDLIFLRIIEGLGWAAFWPSIDSAVIYDTKADPNRVLAIFNLSWSLANSLGPLFGAFVVVILSVRLVFIFNSIFLLTAFLLNLSMNFLSGRSSITANTRNEEIRIAETKLQTATISGQAETPTYVDSKILKVRPLFYVLSLVLCTIVYSTLASFFAPYLHSQGVPTLTIGSIAFMYGLVRFIGYVLVSGTRLRHFLIDLSTRTRNIFLLLFPLSLSPLLMLVHGNSSAVYYLCFGIVGFSFSFVFYIAMVSLLSETSKKKIGAGAGVFETSIGIGSFVGPVIAGFASGRSLTFPFIVPSLISIPIFIALFLLSWSTT